MSNIGNIVKSAADSWGMLFSGDPVGAVNYGWNQTVKGLSYPFKQVGNYINSNHTPGNNISYDDYNGDWMRFLRDKANSGDEASLDRMMNYIMTEASNDRARKWTANREDNAYQRLVKDLRAAGINPMVMFQGVNPIASSSSGSTYSGNPYISNNKNYQTNATNWAKIITSFLTSVASLGVSAVSRMSTTESSSSKSSALSYPFKSLTTRL